MNHTATPSAADAARDSDLTLGQLANPRRIRLGADGRPITGQAGTAGDAAAA